MAKKSKGLTEDELKWILSLDASEAQQAIHETEKESNQLIATNKKLKEKMVELVAAGEKELSEYKNLSAEIEHNNSKLDKNNEKIKELEKRVGLTSLTMNQLRKKAKDLQYQLDHTSKALNPEEYAKINQELLEVRARMEELRKSGSKTNSALNAQSVSVSKLTTLFQAFMALKVVQYLKDLFLQSYNTRKEFARYEAVLTNTFQSQEKATKAMSMLKKTAADTPYQLQELTESYVRLVNRGIIPTQNELIKLGDLSASQGKSLDQLVEAILDAQTGEFERLKEFGIKASKSGDVVKFTFKGISTSVKYTEKAISEYIYSLGELKGVQGGMAMQMEQLEGKASNFGDTMDALYNKIGTKLEPAIKSFFSIASHSVQQLSDSMKPLNESFDEQMEKVVSLEQNLPPLLQRYQELKTKTTLSKEEHAELNKIIGNLGSIVPGAITAWDQYGNAIDINTDKVYQFLEAQQNSLKYEHKDLIKETEQNIKTFKLQKEMLEKEMAQGGEYKAGKYGDYLFEPYSPEVIAIKVKQINDFGKNIQGAEEYLKKINGESLRNQIEGQKETIKKRNEFNGMTKEQLSEYIKINKDASDQYIAIAEDIYNEKFKEKEPKPKTNPYEQNLKAVDELISQKRLKISEDYATGLILQDQYNKQLEALELESLNRKLAIYGVGSEERKKIEQQILDYKIKLMKSFFNSYISNLDQEAEKDKEQEQKKKEHYDSLNAQLQDFAEKTSKQQDEQRKKEIEANELRAQAIFDFTAQVGETLGQSLTDTETSFADAMGNMLLLTLDALRQTTVMAIAEATIKSVAEKGLAGVPIAAAKIALINVAFGAVKGLIKRPSVSSAKNDTSGSDSKTGQHVVTGKESGGYIHVSRAQDNKEFNALLSPGQRGYIDRPTVIVGEGPDSQEWVASNAALKNPTVAPIIQLMNQSQEAGTIRTIDMNQLMRQRLAGFSSGGFITSPSVTSQLISSSQPSPSTPNGIGPILSELTAVLSEIKRSGIKSKIVYSEFQKVESEYNKSINIGSK